MVLIPLPAVLPHTSMKADAVTGEPTGNQGPGNSFTDISGNAAAQSFLGFWLTKTLLIHICYKKALISDQFVTQ